VTDIQEFTSTPPSACTNACTGKPENGNGAPAEPSSSPPHSTDTGDPESAHADPLEGLAAALRSLSADDRAKLVAMLTSGKDDRP
jgi:hypothetical protein